jgi:hypothetical protein
VRSSWKISQAALDVLAGLASGHSAKILCGKRGPGRVSLPALLDALGCSLLLVEDTDKT